MRSRPQEPEKRSFLRGSMSDRRKFEAAIGTACCGAAGPIREANGSRRGRLLNGSARTWSLGTTPVFPRCASMSIRRIVRSLPFRSKYRPCPFGDANHHSRTLSGLPLPRPAAGAAASARTIVVPCRLGLSAGSCSTAAPSWSSGLQQTAGQVGGTSFGKVGEAGHGSGGLGPEI
jgi:hypothetical protein